MKIRRTVIFILIGILIIVGASQMVNHLYIKNNHTVAGRNQSLIGIQNEPENSIDVLVVGDSESYTSISPMVLWEKLGTTTYVCGQAGQQVTESYTMLKTALQTQKPKVLLLETNLFFRYQSFIKGMKQGMNDELMEYFSLFRYHNMWKQLIAGSANVDAQYFKGFQIRDEVNPYEGPEYMKKTQKQKEIPGFVQFYLEKILKLCQDNGIQVVFYSAPSPINYNYRKHNAIEAFAKEHQVPYIDYNLIPKDLGIDWNFDSLDRGDHLNIAGAKKVSEHMAEYLGQQDILPNHGKDPGYEEWNRNLKEYQAIEAKKIEWIGTYKK